MYNPKIDPDIFDRLSRKGYLIDGGPADRLVHTIPPDIEPDKSGGLQSLLQAYGENLDDRNSKLYRYAKMATSIGTNPLESHNLISNYRLFMMQTLKELYPGQDWTAVETKYRDAETTLKTQLKPLEERDNNHMIPILVGILEKLI